MQRSWYNVTRYEMISLKGLAQAKIRKKSVILFWLLNMTIWCKHVHRLELQKFFNFCAAHSPVRLDIGWFLIIDNHVKNYKYGDFVSTSSLTGECAAEKLKNFCSSSLWTCLHDMVILRSQNKITDFFMILAWVSPFNMIWYDTSIVISMCVVTERGGNIYLRTSWIQTCNLNNMNVYR